MGPWEEHPEPCERTKMTTPKKEPWFLAGSGELTVGPADQPAVLAGLRRRWQSRGYEIVISEHGRLVATDPGTGAGITLWTVKRPDIVYVYVKSACMRPAEGEDPGYEGI